MVIEIPQWLIFLLQVLWYAGVGTLALLGACMLWMLIRGWPPRLWK